MVGERRRCDADYPPPEVWQDAEHEHAGAIFFGGVCRQRRVVSGAFYLERGKIQRNAGYLSGDQPDLRQCEGEKLPGYKGEDLLAAHGSVFPKPLFKGLRLDERDRTAIL